MSGYEKSVTVAPSFLRTLAILLLIIPAALVLALVINLLQGKTPLANLVKHWSAEESFAVLVGLGVLSICAALLTMIYRVAALEVSERTVAGRTLGGRRVEFPAQSISDVEYRRNPKVPGILVRSTESPDAIFAPLWGVDYSKAASEVSSVLGTQHLLSRWFREHAT